MVKSSHTAPAAKSPSAGGRRLTPWREPVNAALASPMTAADVERSRPGEPICQPPVASRDAAASKCSRRSVALSGAYSPLASARSWNPHRPGTFVTPSRLVMPPHSLSLPSSMLFSSAARDGASMSRQRRTAPEHGCFRTMVLYIGIIIGIEG